MLLRRDMVGPGHFFVLWRCGWGASGIRRGPGSRRATLRHNRGRSRRGRLHVKLWIRVPPHASSILAEYIYRNHDSHFRQCVGWPFTERLTTAPEQCIFRFDRFWRRPRPRDQFCLQALIQDNFQRHQRSCAGAMVDLDPVCPVDAPSPAVAALAMSLSSVSLISNALRLRATPCEPTPVKRYGDVAR
jgi:hypothetical protein